MTVKKNFVTVIECQQKFRDRHEISKVNVMEFLSSIFCQSFLFSYYVSKNYFDTFAVLASKFVPIIFGKNHRQQNAVKLCNCKFGRQDPWRLFLSVVYCKFNRQETWWPFVNDLISSSTNSRQHHNVELDGWIWSSSPKLDDQIWPSSFLSVEIYLIYLRNATCSSSWKFAQICLLRISTKYKKIRGVHMWHF